MKHQERLRRLKEAKQAVTPPPVAAPEPWHWSLKWIAAVLVTLVVFLITIFLFENVVLSRFPDEMLGEWEVVAHDVVAPNEGNMVGLKLDFQRNGSLRLKKGNAEVETFADIHGDELRFVVRGETVRGPIMHLSATEFVMESEHGSTIRMVRK